MQRFAKFWFKWCYIKNNVKLFLVLFCVYLYKCADLLDGDEFWLAMRLSHISEAGL